MSREARWQRDGACARQVGHADWWFPKEGENADRARAICARCPVRDPCLRYALEHGIADGVWGGRSRSERRALRQSTD